MVSSTSALDLSQLAPPEVVEQLSYEAIRAAIVDQLVAELPAFDATVTSDPAVKVLEVVAYREMLIRQQFNERARQVMLAYATGSNLDQLGALLDVGRLEGEDDTAYRARIQLAPEAFSVAGPASAYRFYALSAAPTIADASVAAPRPDDIRAVVMGCLAAQGAVADLVAAMEAALDAMVWPGTVIISLLSSLGDGSASAAEIEAVEMAVAEDVRPLTDWPKVVSASIVPYEIDIDLTIYTGPDETVVLAAVQQAVEAYRAGARKLGRAITRAGLFGAAMVSGVHNAVINQPPADVPITRQQAGACLGVAVRIAGHVD
ncbi:baseplate assembly protein [Novosphingobium pituita]|uniref:Baseplate J/gp47 family protein n=1 Tax=Novosphingobium pituita TaxID=3056842 RepID=A0ABQ6P3U6_9SPHN|nr:baseplate J/gp47 family protein [Novosphingobium sp. IK01]GMM59905.1 baseplate J/gp47 family protein [Novosphingobium sp. IK01]